METKSSMGSTVRGISIRSSAVTLGFSWPLIVALSALFGVLLLLPAGRGLEDGDTYWHIAAGDWMIAHWSIPAGDPFSYSMPGATWITQEWLSQVVMSTVYGVGGWAAVQVLGVTSFALALAGLTRFLLRRLEPIHALLLVGFAAGAMLTHLLVRPHVLVWPIFAVWVGTLIQAAESRSAPPWWLLLVMMLWANLHGDFTLGLLLAAGIAADAVVAYPVGERRAGAARWSAFVVLAILVSLLTPNGWRGLWLTVQVMRQDFALSNVGEWASLNFHFVQVLEIWLMGLLLLACTGRLRLSLMRTVMLLGLVHLALHSARNVAPLGLISPFLLATPLARGWYRQQSLEGSIHVGQLDHWFRAFAQPARTMTVVLATAISVTVLMAVVPARDPLPAANMTPEAALMVARASGVSGPVLNGYSFGGYLIFQGVKVLIDSRSDMYGDSFMKRYVEALYAGDANAFTSLLREYSIGWTILAPDTPVITLLDRMKGWRRVHADDIAVIHMRVENVAAY
jgi:hypothetical protein